MRSPLAIMGPLTEMDIGAVAVRVVASLWKMLCSRE